MFTKYLLPMTAFAGLAFAVFAVIQSRQLPPPSHPLVPPPTAPEFRALAGAGLIEAQRENIPIGTHEPGIVVKVHVAVDERDPKTGETRKTFVKQGDPLFQLDDRQARAELRVREAQLASAEAELHKLKVSPRPEDLPPAEAAVAEAEARFRMRRPATNAPPGSVSKTR